MAQGVPVARLSHLDEIANIHLEEVEETCALFHIHFCCVRQFKCNIFFQWYYLASKWVLR